MDMDDYQTWTRSTAIYPGTGDLAQLYVMTALTSEVGELASLLKRKLRDGTPEDVFVAEMKKELGDVLWYMARFADELGLSLGDIADANKTKLMQRQTANSLHGKSGDR